MHEALNDIQKLPSVNYDLRDQKRVVTETTERYGKIKGIAMIVGPILESEKMRQTVQLIKEEEILSKKMIENLYGHGPAQSLKNILLKRQEVEKSLVCALSSGIADLTLNSRHLNNS